MPAEADAFAASVVKVRRASGSARIVARQLLAQLGHGQCAVPKSASGAPTWPADVVGSMAHDSRVAVAAVAMKFAILPHSESTSSRPSCCRPNCWTWWRRRKNGARSATTLTADACSSSPRKPCTRRSTLSIKRSSITTMCKSISPSAGRAYATVEWSSFDCASPPTWPSWHSCGRALLRARVSFAPPSCPRLSRASTSLTGAQVVDGTQLGLARVAPVRSDASRVNPTCGDKPGHDDDMVRYDRNVLKRNDDVHCARRCQVARCDGAVSNSTSKTTTGVTKIEMMNVPKKPMRR